MPSGGPTSNAPGLRAWSVLFGCLAAAGGHGVLLFAALSESGSPRLEEVGRGRLGALAIAWLLACPVLALLGLVLRRRLMRSRWLAPFAAGGAAATALAFGFYLATVAR